jgi:hypothetical protein
MNGLPLREIKRSVKSAERLMKRGILIGVTIIMDTIIIITIIVAFMHTTALSGGVFTGGIRCPTG